MISVKNTFGSNLSSLRKQAGLSQESLAEQLGISRQAISNWERDLSEPDIETIKRTAELLHVPVSNLMEFTGDSHSPDTAPAIKPTMTIISAVISLIHLACGISGFVNVVAVVVLPITCSFITLIMYFSFSKMLQSNHYDMLAGYNPKRDSIKATQLQMYWCAILSGLTSIIFNVIFILIYFTAEEKQMSTTIIMSFTYYAAISISCIAVNIKIKSHK